MRSTPEGCDIHPALSLWPVREVRDRGRFGFGNHVAALLMLVIKYINRVKYISSLFYKLTIRMQSIKWFFERILYFVDVKDLRRFVHGFIHSCNIVVLETDDNCFYTQPL